MIANIIVGNIDANKDTNIAHTGSSDNNMKNSKKTNKENFSKEFDSKLSETEKDAGNNPKIKHTESNVSEKSVKKAKSKTIRNSKKQKKVKKDNTSDIRVVSGENINILPEQKNHIKKSLLKSSNCNQTDKTEKTTNIKENIIKSENVKKHAEKVEKKNQPKKKNLFSDSDKILKTKEPITENNRKKSTNTTKTQSANKKTGRIFFSKNNKKSIQNKQNKKGTKIIKDIPVENNTKTESTVKNSKNTGKINIKIKTRYQHIKKNIIEKPTIKTENNKPNSQNNLLTIKKFEKIISTHEKFSTDSNSSNNKDNNNFFSFNHGKFENKLSQLFSSKQPEVKFSESSREIDFKKILDKIKDAVKPPVKNEITIQLKPENLGKLKILLTMDNNTLKGKIITEHKDVQQTILNNFNQLETALKEKGINLSNFNVTVDNENFSKDHQNNKKSFQSNKRERKEKIFSIFNNEEIIETDENIRLEYKSPYNFNNLNIII